MPQAEAEEPAEHLIETAREAGFEVSRVQLHRWQRAGLLPRPRQQGLGRGRGSGVLYPAGSASQLVAVCLQLAERRSLRDAAWFLWWDRHWLEESRLRQLFKSQIDFAKALSAAFDLETDVDAPANTDRESSTLLDEVATARRLKPLVAHARRRTRKKHFASFLRIISSLVGGRAPDLVDDDAAIAIRGFGLGHMAAPEQFLADVASQLDPAKLEAALDAATTADLESARDEIRSFLGAFEAVAALLQHALSHKLDPIFLATLRNPSTEDGLHFVLLWLSIRSRPEIREALAQIRQLLTGEKPLGSSEGELE